MGQKCTRRSREWPQSLLRVNCRIPLPDSQFLPVLVDSNRQWPSVKRKQNTSKAKCVNRGCKLKRRRGSSLRECLRKYLSLSEQWGLGRTKNRARGRHFWSGRWQRQMETVTSDGRGLVCLLFNTATRCAQTRRMNPAERPQAHPL